MPYKLSKQGSKWCVLKEDGENTGCSDTRAMAVKHMRALYANSDKAASKAWHPDASYLNDYIRYCNMLIEHVQYSFQYEDSEHEELANFGERLIDQLSEYQEQLIGWRNQWYGSPEDFKALDEQSIVDKVVSGIKGWFDPQWPVTSKLEVQKQADGRARVTMAVSNTFRDRHKEEITEEAHTEYAAYVKEAGDYPEFWLWHIPGSRWGLADSVIYDKELNVLTVSGLADPGMEYIAEAIARNKDIGVSHGFNGWGRAGYVDWYRMKEASPLPREEAANVWTGILERGMALTDKHKKFLEGLGVPPVFIDDLDKRNKDVDGAAKEAGLELKDLETKPDDQSEAQPKTDEAQPKPSTVEATLPDGTKVQIPADVAKALAGKPEQPAASSTGTSGIDSGNSDVPAWAKELIDSNKQLQKELEEVKSKQTVESWEAAIKQGSGFVASKEGESPSDKESKDNGEWLAELITGGTR